MLAKSAWTRDWAVSRICSYRAWGHLGGDQLRSDFLKLPCGFNLQREQLFVPPQRLMSGFQFPGAFLPTRSTPDSHVVVSIEYIATTS